MQAGEVGQVAEVALSYFAEGGIHHLAAADFEAVLVAEDAGGADAQRSPWRK